MNLNLSAWRSDQHEEYVYVVQISNIKHGDNGVISKLFDDWKIVSHGWNIKSDSKLLILNKRFDSEKEWKEWAKKCPVKLLEYKYRAGKQKVIQHSCKTRKKRTTYAKE